MSGSFHLVHASPTPVVHGLVSPAAREIHSVRFRGAVWRDGRWSLYGSHYARLSSTSKFAIAAVGFKPGERLRLAVTYPGSDANAASPTAYYYMKLY